MSFRSRSIVKILSTYFRNLRGWRTRRKIIVFESDDWGSVRMPSKKVYQKCLNAGYRVDLNPYEKYDSLASEEDLELLFDILSSHKDYKGNHPIVTANSLVANPDFKKISRANFEQYYYELITETFKRYPKHSKCLDLWKIGLKSGVFYPQSHGREHLNVSMFMKSLQEGDKDVRFGFAHEMPGSIRKNEFKGGNKYVEALRYTDREDKLNKLDTILEGLDIFEELFGYKSKTFIPPNYIWSSDFDKKLAERGVMYYQGIRKLKEPLDDGSVKLKCHYLGQENKYGQIYLVRNAFFEPSIHELKIDDWVLKCLRDIEIAFKMNKPAIVCTHRLNYVGFIDKNNRDKNLRLFNDLLKKILEKWPNVEFMNSEDLGGIINENSHSS